MKKYMTLLPVLISGFVCFAQSTFTQSTFKTMLDDYRRDSREFFVNRLSDDFRYSDSQGQFLYKSDLTKNDPQKILTTLRAFDRMLDNLQRNDLEQPVIFQSCNLGIVSGIHKTTLLEKDGNEIAAEVACTYTFQKRKGKWMLVASQQTRLIE